MKDLGNEDIFCKDKTVAILFWATWAEPSLLIEQFLDDQATEYQSVLFGKINADMNPEHAQHFAVSSIPTVIFVRGGKVVDKYVGSDPMQLVSHLQSLSTKSPLEERLKQLINKAPFMIFIKGTPSAPRCGFTGTLLRTLNQLGVSYDYFDILSDDEVRQGLKEYSQWPTYPQIYVKGELLGGLDIFLDMVQTGQIQDVLN